MAITPEYLQKVGLLAQLPSADADIPQLLKQALDRVAFLPFGFTIDPWRWKVFSGEIQPADYNQAWWDLRLKYQGIAPPIARSERDFDPGAKYHIAANVPSVGYFLAYILEFQFYYRALCHEAGYTGPLNRCTFFGSKEAGAKFEKMLEMGQGKPWPDALEVLTGQRQMDASAILEYFAPLQKWLDEQNKSQKIRMVTFSLRDRPIPMLVPAGRFDMRRMGWVYIKAPCTETEIPRWRVVCPFSEAVLP